MFKNFPSFGGKKENKIQLVVPPFPDSPERIIGTIFIGDDVGERFPGNLPHPAFVFRDELGYLSEVLGFSIQKGWNTDIGGAWLRDTQIVLSNGCFLVPPNARMIHELTGKSMTKIVGEMDSATKLLLPSDCYVHLVGHPDRNRVPLKVYDNREVNALNIGADRHGIPVKYAKTLVEGGNILVATRSNGQLGAIIGEASLIQSLIVLQEQSLFETSAVKAEVKKLEKRLTAGLLSEDELNALFDRLIHTLICDFWDAYKPNQVMRAVLDLDDKLYSHFTDKDNFSKDGDPFSVAQMEPFLVAQVEKKDKRRLVLTYLAKLELTKTFIADDLGMTVENLVFVDQPSFHLDMAMAVGPNGTILVQSQIEASILLTRMLRELNTALVDKLSVESLNDSTSQQIQRMQRKKGRSRINSVDLTTQTGGLAQETTFGKKKKGIKRIKSMELLPSFITEQAERREEKKFVQTVRRYLEAANALVAQMGALELRISTKLGNAGYDCFAVPGSFIDPGTNVEPGKPINFFNHLGGTIGPRSVDEFMSGDMYYITNGVSGKSAQIFQEYFETMVLRPLGYKHIFFLGCEHGLAHASLREMGALRCLTTVLPKGV